MTRGPALVLRLLSAFLLLLIATFYLLASIPFAYYQFLQSPPWPWMPAFVRVHPLLLIAALLGLRAVSGPLVGALRIWSRRTLVVTMTVAGCMAVAAWTPALQSYELSAVFCFVPLAVMTGAAAIELASRRRTLARERDSGARGHLVETAALAGAVASATFAVQVALVERAGATLQPAELAVGSAVALAAHVGLFGGVAAATLLVRVVAARLAWSRTTAWLATSALTAGWLAVLVRRAVLTALSFDDRRAEAVAVALAVSLVGFGKAWASSRPAEPGASAPRRPWSVAVPFAAAIGVLVFVLPPMLRLADWGFTLQKVLVMLTWLAAGQLLAAVSPGRRPRVRTACVLIAIWAGAVATGVAMDGDRPRAAAPFEAGLAVERYATFDVSLRIVLDVVRPMMSGRAFLSTLRREGDATDNRRLRPVPLRLVESPRVDPSYRPHIFVIVVDSLRPDYLSAYNPAVTFTPGIGAFARESIVMRRAFTAYSGTALSEPALWAGGLVPRAIYVKPFAPMNNLERLVEAGGYRRYVSIDEVLDQILDDPAGALVRLDAAIVHPERENEAYKLDLCSTLDELTGRLAADGTAAPVFFYSQPKNLHIRVIAGEAPRYDRLRPAPGAFFQPAVTTLARLDRCFGRFIEDLKARRLYDDSIVVLTSDHGDAYGEEGRWGHAFYVSPETLRIPLIIHVPDRLLAGRRWDANAPAWLTDVTPTLYDLLGDPPTSLLSMVGRPLLSRREVAVPPAPDGPYLVQSSYSRVFGLVGANADWLYTADANRFSENFFDLREPAPLGRPLAEADSLRYQRQLLDRVRELNAYYVKGEN